MSHIEIPVKVNAWIDKDIAPLVLALNRFDGVITVDSCQGKNGHGYVYFTHHGNPEDLASFIQRLSASIGKKIPSGGDFSFRLEWLAGSERPMAQLVVKGSLVEPLANTITEIAASSGHTNRSRRGRCDKAPRN